MNAYRVEDIKVYFHFMADFDNIEEFQEHFVNNFSYFLNFMFSSCSSLKQLTLVIDPFYGVKFSKLDLMYVLIDSFTNKIFPGIYGQFTTIGSVCFRVVLSGLVGRNLQAVSDEFEVNWLTFLLYYFRSFQILCKILEFRIPLKTI